MAVVGFFIEEPPPEPRPRPHIADKQTTYLTEVQVAYFFNVSVSAIRELRRFGDGPAHYIKNGEVRYKVSAVTDALSKAMNHRQSADEFHKQIYAEMCRTFPDGISAPARTSTREDWDKAVEEMQKEHVAVASKDIKHPIIEYPPIRHRCQKSIDRDRIRQELKISGEWRRWGRGSDARKVAWAFVGRADNWGRFLPGWSVDDSGTGWVALFDEFERLGIRAKGFHPKLGDRVILPPAPSPHRVVPGQPPNV